MNHTVRKTLAILLAALLMMAALAGCSGSGEPAETKETADTAGQTDTQAEPDESETEPEKEPEPAPYQHVVLIGVDGGGAFFKDADMPNLNAIMADAAVTYSMLTSNPTISAQCWGSMLTGVLPEIHGLTNDLISNNPYKVDSPYPSVFRIVHENMPDAALVSVCNWDPINYGIIEEGLGVVKDHNSSDKIVSEKVAEYIKELKPALTFVQLDQVDGAGHGSGFGGTNYMKQMHKEDTFIQNIYDACVEAGIIKDTLFIVTADHGGNEKSHGGWTDGEKYVMFAAAGSTVVKNGEIQEMFVRDVPSVILYALGLSDKQPETWAGAVPGGLFEGVEAGERHDTVVVKEYNPIRDREMEETPAAGSGRNVADTLDADRLALYLPFDGDSKDVTGGIETEANGKLYFVDGFFGQSIELDDGYVSLKDFSVGSDSFSVGFFLKTPGVDGDPSIISNKNWNSGTNVGFILALQDGHLRFNAGNGKSLNFGLNYSLPDNYRDGWMYVMLTVDREAMRVGVSIDFDEPVYQALDPQFTQMSFDALEQTCIGQDGTGAYPINLRAQLDEFVVVKGVVNGDELAALKTAYMGE